MLRQETETTDLEGTIWSRLIGPSRPTLSPEVARCILELEFPKEDRVRLSELAAKARAGKLTRKEREEVEAYSRVGSILGVMKSKARVSLKKAARTNGRGR